MTTLARACLDGLAQGHSAPNPTPRYAADGWAALVVAVIEPSKCWPVDPEERFERETAAAIVRTNYPMAEPRQR